MAVMLRRAAQASAAAPCSQTAQMAASSGVQPCRSPEFPRLRNNAYRVRARVNVLMPGGKSIFDHSRKPDGTLLETYGKPEGITLGEMQLCAETVLKCVMELKEL